MANKLKILKYFHFILLFLILNSCATNDNRKKFSEFIHKNECKKASLNIPETRKQKVSSFLNKAWKAPISYIMSGFGHTADFLLLASSGIVTIGVACGPFIVASLYSSGGSANTLNCLPVNLLVKTNYGKRLYKHTEKLRCSKIDHISQSLREVSSCYLRQGKKDKAKKQLKIIKEDYYFKTCLSKNEYAHVISMLNKIK